MANYKPLDWNDIAIPVNSLSGGTITSGTVQNMYSLPGELLDYTMKYDMDWIRASGWDEQDLHDHLKKELAAKLAAKMMEDGHFVFTRRTDPAADSVSYRAYTWVGNKAFIEQQRKNKR